MSHEYSGTLALKSLPGPIAFKGVCFRYPTRPQHPVLRHLHLTIPLGTMTAIVGSSGCGKTSVTSLLLGLYAPAPDAVQDFLDGRPAAAAAASDVGIFLGEHPLAALHLPSVRALIAFVPQHPILFPASIAANIAYGLPAHMRGAGPRGAVARAAALAGLDAFIRSLPDGYGTAVGEGGLGLSGGQVQRLALARALVRRPQALILDEPTSSLDAASARTVRQVLRALVRRERLTVVTVTHDREMMEALGRVVVLGDGRVVEEGSCGMLMRKRGGHLRRLLAEDEV